jgi:hypothetical protein
MTRKFYRSSRFLITAFILSAIAFLHAFVSDRQPRESTQNYGLGMGLGVRDALADIPLADGGGDSVDTTDTGDDCDDSTDTDECSAP